MKTYDDIEPTEHIKVLFWAPSGAGKTSFASTWPGVVFVDCDMGIDVIKSKAYLDIYGSKPDLVGYKQFDDKRAPKTGLFISADAYWEVIEFMNELLSMEEVQTIVIDSLSSFQVLAMNVGLELSGVHKRSQTLAKARMAKGIPIALPTQADFGSEMSAFQQFMDQAIGFPKNIIFIAHERDETNPEGISVRREPLLIGSAIRARVGKWFNEVWYLDVGKGGERRLLTNSTNKLKGLKSGSLSIPDGLSNPTYERIMEEVKKQAKKS